MIKLAKSLITKLSVVSLCFILLLYIPSVSANAASFPDIKKGSWYEQAVTEMEKIGLIGGYPDGTFRPNRTITAAEFVVIVSRTAGLEPSSGQTSHWASDTLAAALEAGWYDWDELPPTGETYNSPITRQVAVKVLMKALFPDVKGDYLTESAKMKDFSSLDGRYYEPVFAAYAAGIVFGDDTGSFRPKSGLTRAQACIMIKRAIDKLGNIPSHSPDTPEPAEPIQGGVSENGALRVSGTKLCNENGEPVVLRGMSSHGIQWYGNFTSSQAIKNTADHGANLFRVAMYTAKGGYISSPSSMKKKAVDAVDAALANDMYVILDWHILSDGNPMTYVNEAVSFFTEMAKKYKDEPGVLFEICNEPNGNVSWEQHIKPYAERVIKAIRDQGSDAVVLVGSGTWSQDIHIAAESPLSGKNIMYTCHFYAGTHGSFLRDRIDSVLKKGLPVFVSEWGASRADGGNGVYLEETKVWLDFLDSGGISWANWSLCDKNESSAALVPGTSPNAKWSDSDLSASGKYVFSRFKD